MDLILKVKDLIAAIRANDWSAMVSLTLAILTMITATMKNPPQVTMHAALESMSKGEIADKLEECCAVHADPNAAHPIIDTFLPLILALLKKLIGF